MVKDDNKTNQYQILAELILNEIYAIAVPRYRALLFLIWIIVT